MTTARLPCVDDSVRHLFVTMLLVLLASAPARSEPPPPDPAAIPAPPEAAAPPPELKWYERIHLRGYTQLRYNRLGETNGHLVNDQGDKSLGAGNGFFLRRARLVFSAEVTDWLSIYLQPDFASGLSDQLNVGMMRDWYADVFLDRQKEFRLRLGQSKVPYGFENMQSSQNRVPFDRSDALNSAVPNERDIGVFFYWAPRHIRARFKHLVDSGLKGSGDYGVAALGVYNGQGNNLKERNDLPHVIARLTWPFQIGEQFLEVGGGGYLGRFGVKYDNGIHARSEYDDMRVHASVILYPQPFGFQAEYNIGKGPRLKGETIEDAFLQGGYVMLLFRMNGFTPYVRASYYDGGKKFETNAPHYLVRELEGGLEWQQSRFLELTASYLYGDRTYAKPPYENEVGGTVRLQAQISY